MQKTQTKNLQVGFGISLLILTGSIMASYFSILSFNKSANMVDHTNIVIQKVEMVLSYLKDAETGQRGYLLTKDETYLEPYIDAAAKTKKELNELKQLTTDNPYQQNNCDSLESMVNARVGYLQKIITAFDNNGQINLADLKQGKQSMDECRKLVKKMQDEETRLLTNRNAAAKKFASITPIFLLLAAAIAVITTIYFYRKTMAGFKTMNQLNESLFAKEKEMAERILVIDKVATQVSQGDYKVRLKENDTDVLGSVAVSLNKMTASLNASFTELAEKQWVQAGTAQLSLAMTGEKTVTELAREVISFTANYTNSLVGVFYIAANNASLSPFAGYAINYEQLPQNIQPGEGLAGEAMLQKKHFVIENIATDNFLINLGTATVRPGCVCVFPVLYENEVRGVIQLGALHTYTAREISFIKNIADNIAIAINTAFSRQKVQELLQETQAQSEELQAQHAELENLNVELEAQAEKLQASEEELKVQQEELMETNQELEERSRLLEEKNNLIVLRNLDIQKKAEELAQNAKYKSEFLANMSHELRTPLNSILLLSRLLTENNEDNLSKDEVEYAQVIQSSGNGLLQLIDEILDLSRIESGKMQLEFEVVATETFARDMRMLFEPMAKEKGIDFKINIHAGVPQHMQTDKMRVDQVLKNLLSNALKFTSRGLIELTIAAAKNEQIKFTVKDSGIGIASEKQQLIFEAFQQADGSTRRKYGGTGLGLSISRQLAKLLGGDITLTSQENKGSAFTLLLPVNSLTVKNKNESESDETFTASNADDDSVTNGNMQIAAPATSNTHNYLSNNIPAAIDDDINNLQAGDKIILIIEDDTSFATALLKFTHTRGYKGLVAVRGDVGIELAQTYNPIGILLDIELPVKNGWQVMEALKSNPRTRHIPVHIMSSHEAKKESLLKGAIDFINKPVAFEQMNTVFQKIENVIKKESKKVLIVEDNPMHAKALSYFLSGASINSEITSNVDESVKLLARHEVDCVILDMGVPDVMAYETLEAVKKNNGLENVPVIIFTGKSLSRTEELRIKQYADAIVVKTAQSYQRILDEVSLFLHVMEENRKDNQKIQRNQQLGSLSEVLKNKKVLVADDDVRNIFSLTKALEKHQMKVIAAMDGKETLALLKENKDTHIVLMDMMMPEMDGYETIATIRQNPLWKKLPIISVTAKAMTGDREKCIQSGASDYISKPVDIDQLVSLLRIWLYESV
jgi:signal transduction histidine kinase/DNA-binding response OmpR family regulator/CHASE3 domain sensor protein